VSHRGISSPLPLTMSQPQLSVQSLPPILIVQVCSVSYQFSPMEKHFIYDAAFKWKVILCTEKVSNHAAGRKHTVSEACVCQSIKIKRLTNRKYFSGTRKGRNLETDTSILEYFKDLQNKGLSASREALMWETKEHARNSNILVPFKDSHGWYEKFMKRESLSLGWKMKVSQNFLWNLELNWLNFSILLLDYAEEISIS
jgi:hypothetical protein